MSDYNFRFVFQVVVKFVRAQRRSEQSNLKSSGPVLVLVSLTCSAYNPSYVCNVRFQASG